MQDVEIDPQMELENIMALLEAEVCVSGHNAHVNLILAILYWQLVGNPYSRAKYLHGWSRIE